MDLEEWRHWLEEVEHPFIVSSDHKNLSYVCTTKRLNARQAPWLLFFNRFSFTFTYHPSSKNTKPDALSRLGKEADTLNTPANILNRQCVVTTLTWAVKKSIQEGLGNDPNPGGAPPRRRYVPMSARTAVLR